MATDPRTWMDLVREVAAEFDLEATDSEASSILWEHTGFPCFWDDNPTEECIAQLREFFAQVKT